MSQSGKQFNLLTDEKILDNVCRVVVHYPVEIWLWPSPEGKEGQLAPSPRTCSAGCLKVDQAMDVLRTDHSAVNGVEWYAQTLNDALQTQCAVRRSLDQLRFRIALARPLTNGYSSRKRKGCPASFQTKKYVVLIDVRLAIVEIICQRWLPTIDDMGNVAERDKKRGPAACVKNVMSLCALEHASHLFMANNHH
ncbi:uncharacterized protein TNCV_1016311 [Trichonephila clavipes]|uniref:Uncharacterized protein n=1 Tax=Trichonephila clavipes TaxID=2585209 RepID=A0A8X7B9X0_TRICX|nr:uncharacterized protein TNCV_1016311 [Trichonephila clavipes]